MWGKEKKWAVLKNTKLDPGFFQISNLKTGLMLQEEEGTAERNWWAYHFLVS